MTQFFVFLHLAGMALWLGGLFAMSLWTARSRASGDEKIVAFTYATASRLYRTLVAGSATLTIISGFVLILVTGRPLLRPFPEHWLFQMQIVGLVVYLVTMLFLMPNARALASLAGASLDSGGSPEFGARVRRQAILGSAVGVALLYLVLLGALRF